MFLLEKGSALLLPMDAFDEKSPVVGYIIMQRIFKHEDIPIKVLDQLSTYMVVSTLVGARLGHCLFYEPQHYLANPLDILKIWEGGLASHGFTWASPPPALVLVRCHWYVAFRLCDAAERPQLPRQLPELRECLPLTDEVCHGRGVECPHV